MGLCIGDRKDARDAFYERRKHNSKRTRNRWGFTVSCYLSVGGSRRYTGPVTNDPELAKPSVQYRIRIYPKGIRNG